MTARNCCAPTTDNNLRFLPDLPCLMPMVRRSRYTSLRSFAENMTRQIFSFAFRVAA
jgi:hypothetical protein